MGEHRYLREEKARLLENLYNQYEDRTGKLRSRSYTNVSLKSLGQIEGAEIANNDNWVVDDCDYCCEIEVNTVDNNYEKILYGKTLYGGFLRTQWGHFIINTSSRLWYLWEDKFINIDNIVFFVDRKDFILENNNYNEFFVRAGIRDKIVLVEENFWASELIVPDLAFENNMFYSNEFNTIFDKIILSVSTEFPNGYKKADNKKIFLTRSGLHNASRHEINIKYLDKFFHNNGYKVISPEKMTLGEFVATLNNAEEIVSISGSLAHNFVFCAGAKTYCIIERSAANNTFQVGINLTKRISPINIDCNYLPLLSTSSGSLFIYGMTEFLIRYIEYYNLVKTKFPSTIWRKYFELLKYCETYHKLYGDRIGVEAWEMPEITGIFEAYYASEAYYEGLIKSKVPLRYIDFLNPIKVLRLLRFFVYRYLNLRRK